VAAGLFFSLAFISASKLKRRFAQDEMVLSACSPLQALGVAGNCCAGGFCVRENERASLHASAYERCARFARRLNGNMPVAGRWRKRWFPAQDGLLRAEWA